MAAEEEFDPTKVGRALALLGEELREELRSERPQHALFRLKVELTSVVLRARTWARERQIPERVIPELPGAPMGPEEALALLRDLAAALRFLGLQLEIPESMSEVVAWLELHQSAALHELSEMAGAVEEVARALVGLESASRALSEGLARVALRPNVSRLASAGLRARAVETHDAAKVVLEAMNELQTALRAWGLVIPGGSEGSA